MANPPTANPFNASVNDVATQRLNDLVPDAAPKTPKGFALGEPGEFARLVLREGKCKDLVTITTFGALSKMGVNQEMAEKVAIESAAFGPFKELLAANGRFDADGVKRLEETYIRETSEQLNNETAERYVRAICNNHGMIGFLATPSGKQSTGAVTPEGLV